ncbi:hypothetical protein C8R43DRAFT_869307, partial [Mycena crocata]
MPEGSQYESFHWDKEVIIRKIVAREVGEVQDLPPHFKPPKVDAPTKYPGTDDSNVIMKFIEMLCTWMQSQMMCGYSPAIDKLRVSMLKSHLSNEALDWFIWKSNQPLEDGAINLTFTEWLCLLHRRFITTANAQRATRAFEAV